ncbi:MAG: tetratricopeptide repeat-containing glycosyltransferase family protein [Pseudomonadota bacterium]
MRNINLLNPRDAFRDALTRHKQGDIDGAIATYRDIIECQPENAADVLSCLGVALRAKGRKQEALIFLAHGAEKGPACSDVQYNYGNALKDEGRYDEAIDRYQKVLQIDPTFTPAYSNWGICLRELGEYEAAQIHFQEGIDKFSDNASMYLDLGVVHWHQKHYEQAIASYERSLALGSANPKVLFNLGVALELVGRHKEAVGHLQKLLEREPGHIDGRSALGQSLVSLGQLDESEPHFRQVLDVNPNHVDAHLGRARAMLLTGDYANGMIEYEWHKRRSNYKPVPLPGSQWNGEDFFGKTILLYGEQGHGDNLNMIRYANQLRRAGAKVIVMSTLPLARLFEQIDAIDTVLRPGERIPHYDAHLSLIELPQIFSSNVEQAVEDAPYIHIDSISVPTDKKRVGLVWAGNPEHAKDHLRSCDLSLFKPLVDVNGISVVSFQFGAESRQLKNNPGFDAVEDAVAGCEDFLDTARQLAQIDLLITVDTAMAHLAGAMGKTVWTLLHYAPDWRWQLHSNTTHWYPSMRLYRQPESGDWPSVFAEVADDLKVWASSSDNQR